MARRIKRPEWWLLMLEMGITFTWEIPWRHKRSRENGNLKFGWYFWRPFLRKQNDSVQFSSMCVDVFSQKKHCFRCSALPKKPNHTSALFKVRCYTKPVPSTWKTQVQFSNHTSGWNGKTSFINLRKSSGGFKIIRKIRPHHLQVKFHFSWLKITRILLHRKCKLAETELKSCDVTTLYR